MNKAFTAAKPQIKSYDPIWEQVRREAEETSADEPVLASLIYATILSEPTLEDAVCHTVAHRLQPSVDTGLLHKTFRQVLTEDPGLGDIFRADRDEDRDHNAGKKVRRDLFARTAHAGGKCCKVASGMFGERSEAPRRIIGHFVDAARLERLGKRPCPHHASHHVDAEPGKNGAPHARRMVEHQERRDTRPHGVSHDVGPLDAEMIEQAPSVFGHDRRAIALRLVQLFALPMPPFVEGNDAAAACHQRTDPAGSIQLVATLEAKPWMSRIGSPSPSSQ